MNYFWTIIIVVVVLTSIIVIGFTAFQVQQQQTSMISDLEYRTAVLSESFKESIEPLYTANSITSLQKILDKFTDKQRLIGLVLYDVNGKVVTSSADLQDEIIVSANPTQAIVAGSAMGNFRTIGRIKVYEFIDPIHEDGKIVGAIMIVQNVNYISSAINQIWTANLIRLLLQILVFAIAVIFLIRWLIFKPVLSMIKSIKSVRAGRPDPELSIFEHRSFFGPLVEEISKISTSLRYARSVASEEARLRMEKTDATWTEERLKEFAKAYLKDQQLFLIYKGEPFSHHKGKNGIYYSSQAGGVPTALEPLMEACGGMWIAHGSADADKETVDENNKIQVPPDNPKYTLKRVWLTEKEVRGHDKGYSAQGLYPLCLNTHTRPVFKEEDWVEYKRVNGKFARELLAEIKDVQRPIIIVNEYHFTLLPKMIKASRPDARVGIFWHTPWPSAEAFSICPQKKEILEGMLGADVIGFHTQQFCNNFIDTIGKNIESLVDFDKSSITRDEHSSYIRAFPIGVAFSNGQSGSDSAPADRKILERLKIKTKFLGLGVDRLDYVKGIPERFKGVEYFLDSYPEYREQFTFLQIASPCRSEIEKYLEYKDVVSAEAERINKKFGTRDWQPIVLEMVQYTHQDLNTLYRLANICVITSLHDGMNLVSKEYVAARNDELGALALSQFTGASHELKGAMIINPYSIKEISDAIHKGITMSPLEQKKRMKTMRNSVKGYNIYRWAAELLKAIVEL